MNLDEQVVIERLRVAYRLLDQIYFGSEQGEYSIGPYLPSEIKAFLSQFKRADLPLDKKLAGQIQAAAQAAVIRNS
jgi:hypothetical protein